MKNKKLLYKISFLVLILSFIIANAMYTGINPQNKLEFPKTSAGEINIITPENNTYIEPMSGYYPATYGFESDENGSDPKDWVVSEVDGTVNLVESKTIHNKVVEFYDTGLDRVGMTNAITRTAGTVEFWVYSTLVSADYSVCMFVYDGSKTNGISLYIYAGNFLYYDGGFHSVLSASADTWYHVKLKFDVDSSGDGTNDWHLWVNGISVDGGSGYSYEGNPSEMDTVWIATGNNPNNYRFYVDAISYSWDPNFSEGDNSKEGLLLSYNNSTSLMWAAYSLDQQVNKTIWGNTTIKMPDLGLHKIRVFGNNSLGTMHQSDLRYFTISEPPIKLITPENIIYTAPMNGYYPATYGFENDKEGTIPYGWTDESSSGLCSISVHNQKDNHKKVIYVVDADTGIGTSADATAQYTFKTTQIAGTIEFWVYKVSGTTPIYIQCNNGATSAFGVRMDYNNNGKIEYNSGPSTWVEFANGKYADQTWFHLRIDFDCVAEETDIYLNGIKEVDNAAFGASVTDVSFLQIRSGYSGSSGSLYFDAVGFSWDPDYTVGDNRYEGLLISFYNSTSLDWIGYSFDGQLNRTIIGNTTIPLPSNGLHSLLLTVNDTVGTYFMSELRYFSVLTSGPIISTITPSINQYYGVTAPSFSIDVQGITLDKFWYSLDNGITNISFYSYSGDISQSEWDKYTHEPVQINFYVNDSLNRIGYDVVTVNKDLNAPTTAINFVPYSGINVVLRTTQFYLMATDNSESGISTTRYKIDDSAWIPYTGAFTLSSYDSGFYTITYQSIDAVGNIETEKSVVIELYIPPTPPPPFELPNLVPLLLISIGIGLVALIGITIFLLVRRRTPKTPIKARTDEKTPSGSDQFKVCPFCFAQIKINAKFCTLCGASLEKD